MAAKIKSAYDLALERLEADGIDKPREEDLDPAILERISEIRNKTEAKLAELEILHRDQRASAADPEPAATAAGRTRATRCAVVSCIGGR